VVEAIHEDNDHEDDADRNADDEPFVDSPPDGIGETVVRPIARIGRSG